MKCKNCRTQIDHIVTSVFDRDGSDYRQLFQIFENIEPEMGLCSVCFETDTNWTGYDLSEDERNETIRCPLCGKNPFPDKEVLVHDVVRVVKFINSGVERQKRE